jgi:hypothetical protein
MLMYPGSPRRDTASTGFGKEFARAPCHALTRQRSLRAPQNRRSLPSGQLKHRGSRSPGPPLQTRYTSKEQKKPASGLRAGPRLGEAGGETAGTA